MTYYNAAHTQEQYIIYEVNNMTQDNISITLMSLIQTMAVVLIGAIHPPHGDPAFDTSLLYLITDMRRYNTAKYLLGPL